MLTMTMKRLQMNLKFLNYYSGAIDGIKGTQTLNAIKQFQSDNNLTVDGIAGQQTIDCLRTIICDIQSSLGVEVDGVAGQQTINARNKQQEEAILLSWDNIKYFKKEEFTCKCGCGLNNIDLKVVSIADKIREHFGKPAIVTSGTRCQKHNKEVGGVANSRHLSGKAIDMYVQGINWTDLLVYINNFVESGDLRYAYHIDNSQCCHFDIK